MTTKTTNKYLFIVLCIIVLVGVFFLLRPSPMMNGDVNNGDVMTPVDTSTTTLDNSTSTTSTQTITTSNGTITFSTPSDFGLAINKSQILVKSYIPPCDDNFDYCLYYNGSDYAGTNFDSAGVRIKTRGDLKTVSACLNTAPTGYDMKSSTVSTSTSYTVSVFAPIGDAGAGHYASGELYRLAYDGTCTEFETRIGATQFANYPAGTIKEFTTLMQDQLKTKMLNIIRNTTLFSGENIKIGK